MTDLPIIGRAELVDFPDLSLNAVPSKTDTGADASSIWVSSLQKTDEGISCIFLGPESTHYTGELQFFKEGDYSVTRVSNSFGQKEIRYKVKLRIRIQGRLINATFTLADRGSKTYPVLIGRRLLHGKFLVDVSTGKPLTKQEKEKKQKLKQDLSKMGYSTN